MNYKHIVWNVQNNKYQVEKFYWVGKYLWTRGSLYIPDLGVSADLHLNSNKIKWFQHTVHLKDSNKVKNKRFLVLTHRMQKKNTKRATAISYLRSSTIIIEKLQESYATLYLLESYGR